MLGVTNRSIGPLRPEKARMFFDHYRAFQASTLGTIAFYPNFHFLYLSSNLSLSHSSIQFRMAEQEPPFYPREKLIEKQKYFQSVQKPTYLKGPYDKVTSVAIPLAFAAASLYMIGKGIYNMSHGIGKKE